MGTSVGLIKFDGKNFQTIEPLANKAVRKIIIDSLHNKIYVGGDNFFGYLKKNKIGKFKYIDLTNKLPDTINYFHYIQSIAVYDDTSIFAGKYFSYVFVDDSLINYFSPDYFNAKYFNIFNIDDTIFLFQQGKGMYKVSPLKLIKQTGFDALRNYDLQAIEHINDTIYLFSISFRPDLYYFYTKTKTVGKIPLKNVKTFIYDIYKLTDGRIIISIIDQGIVILNKDFSISSVFFKKLGLINNIVMSAYEYQGNIFLGTTGGLTIMDNNSGIYYFKDEYINLNTFTGIHRNKDSLLFTTIQGLFAGIIHQHQKVETVPIKITDTIAQNIQFFRLQEYDNNMFLMASAGYYRLLNNNKIKRIKGIPSSNITFKMKYQKDTYFVSDISGFYIIKKDSTGKFNTIYKRPFNEFIFDFAAIDSTHYLLYTYASKVHVLEVENNENTFTLITPYDYLTDSISRFFFNLDDTLLMFNDNETSIFRVTFNSKYDTVIYAPSGIKITITENSSKPKSFGSIYNSYLTRGKNYYLLRKGYLNKIRFKDNEMILDNSIFKILDENFYFFSYIDTFDNLLWFGAPNYIYNVSLNQTIHIPQYNASVSKVEITGIDSTIAVNGLNPKTILPYKYNSLRFNFTAFFYTRPEKLTFSYKVEGFNHNWSKFSTKRMAEYTNLPPGTYTFKVKAKNIYGTESTVAKFKFTILPPWYMTWWAYMLYIVLAIGIIVLIVRLYSAKLKADNKKLELIVKARTKALIEKNELITNSIEYAKKIQDAILPSEAQLKKYFPDSFLIFKPRDIVSGDFFWIHKISGSQFIIALSDCTGHGVPGAFMSMIGNTLLNEIVKEHGITNPATILEELHEGIVTSLQNNNELSFTFDGMDIVVTHLDLNKKELKLASASQYAFIFADGTLHTFFGDLYSIGDPLARTEMLRFNTYSIKYNHTLNMFFSSDGYFDQFGGPENKKFSVTNFIALLKEIYNLPAEKQKAILLETLKKWQGNAKQIDDIIVLGINIS